MESKYKHLYNQLQAQIEKREYKAGTSFLPKAI